MVSVAWIGDDGSLLSIILALLPVVLTYDLIYIPSEEPTLEPPALLVTITLDPISTFWLNSTISKVVVVITVWISWLILFNETPKSVNSDNVVTFSISVPG